MCFDFISLVLLNVFPDPEPVVRLSPTRSATDPSWSPPRPCADSESEGPVANCFATRLNNGVPQVRRIRGRLIQRIQARIDAKCFHKCSRLPPVHSQNPVSVRVLFSWVRASKMARKFGCDLQGNLTNSIGPRACTGRIKLDTGWNCFEVNRARRENCCGQCRAARTSYEERSDCGKLVPAIRPIGVQTAGGEGIKRCPAPARP